MSLWMAQCNITLYIVVFNLDKKKISGSNAMHLGKKFIIAIFSAIVTIKTTLQIGSLKSQVCRAVVPYSNAMIQVPATHHGVMTKGSE